MKIRGLDHLYIETHSFEATRHFWEGLGFELVHEWGDDGHRAGKLSCGEMAVVIAEVPADEKPVLDLHFGLPSPEAFMERLLREKRVEVTRPLHDSHWGTRLIQVKDPDGRTYWLESRGD